REPLTPGSLRLFWYWSILANILDKPTLRRCRRSQVKKFGQWLTLLANIDQSDSAAMLPPLCSRGHGVGRASAPIAPLVELTSLLAAFPRRHNTLRCCGRCDLRW